MNVGFDQGAAEAYLRELRGQPAASRRPAKLAQRAVSDAPLASPLIPTKQRRATRRARTSRTVAAVLVAIAAPASLGLAIVYWHSSNPAVTQPEPAPVSSTLRDSAPAARAEINAYAATDPVPLDQPPRDVAVLAARPAWASLKTQRANIPARSAGISAPADDPAPDYPTYGILDPAPSSPKPVDASAAN
jgi:hypothetical protein